MIKQTIITKTSTSQVFTQISTKVVLEEIEEFLKELKRSKKAKIGDKSIALGDEVKCEFEISESNNGRKSLEIELEW